MAFIFAAPEQNNKLLYQPAKGFALIASISTHAYTKFSVFFKRFLIAKTKE